MRTTFYIFCICRITTFQNVLMWDDYTVANHTLYLSHCIYVGEPPSISTVFVGRPRFKTFKCEMTTSWTTTFYIFSMWHVFYYILCCTVLGMHFDKFDSWEYCLTVTPWAAAVSMGVVMIDPLRNIGWPPSKYFLMWRVWNNMKLHPTLYLICMHFEFWRQNITMVSVLHMS